MAVNLISLWLLADGTRDSRPLFSGRYSSTIYNYRRQLLGSTSGLQYEVHDPPGVAMSLSDRGCLFRLRHRFVVSVHVVFIWYLNSWHAQGSSWWGRPSTKPLYAVQGASVAPPSRKYVPVLESHTVPPKARHPCRRSLTFSVLIHCQHLPWNKSGRAISGNLDHDMPDFLHKAAFSRVSTSRSLARSFNHHQTNKKTT